MSDRAPAIAPALWTRLREFLDGQGTGTIVLMIERGQAVELAITETVRVPRRPGPAPAERA